MAVNFGTVSTFYARPKVGGASEFGLGMTGLAITNVKAVGHRFRKILGDPAATMVDDARGGENGGTASIPERVVHAANFVPACFLQIGAVRARCVCKIDTEGTDFQGARGTWFGTGFLVAPDILLTNHHVLNSIEVARNAWCTFNFETGPDNKPLQTKAVRLEPERLFVTSALQDGLDYTFVGIDTSAAEQYGHIPMLRNSFTVHPGDAANIVQHPEGRHKEVTLQQNEVLQDTGVLLHYASDTLGGSSGSPVFNNRWELIGLHHASRKNDQALSLGEGRPVPEYLNEGIKISAIAADLEARVEAGKGVTAARAVLKAMGGVDTLMGFFGALGRHPEPGSQALERVVETYSGEGRDVDVVFWNVEWFTNCYRAKVGALAEVVADLNADVWVLLDASAEATAALLDQLQQDYDMDFGCAHAEPGNAPGLRGASVIWNMATTVGERVHWPAEVEDWFRVDSRQFGDLRLEAAHGPVFERYPGIFRIRAANRAPDADPFAFLLVPLDMGFSVDGGARHRLAARILAAAVHRMVSASADCDWLIGGEYAADITTQELRGIVRDGLAPLSAAEAGVGAGAVSYLKTASSLIEHIFLSRNLVRTFGADDFFVAAADRELPDYVRLLSERAPVLVRLALADRLPQATALPSSLAEALGLG
jgi:V8-like Glu-specific endopeptidase